MADNGASAVMTTLVLLSCAGHFGATLCEVLMLLGYRRLLDVRRRIRFRRRQCRRLRLWRWSRLHRCRLGRRFRWRCYRRRRHRGRRLRLRNCIRLFVRVTHPTSSHLPYGRRSDASEVPLPFRHHRNELGALSFLDGIRGRKRHVDGEFAIEQFVDLRFVHGEGWALFVIDQPPQ
jgi:hypothetical protein